MTAPRTRYLAGALYTTSTFSTLLTGVFFSRFASCSAGMNEGRPFNPAVTLKSLKGVGVCLED